MRDVILVPGLGKNHNERMFLWLTRSRLFESGSHEKEQPSIPRGNDMCYVGFG